MTYTLVNLYSNFKLVNAELRSDNQNSVYFLSLLATQEAQSHLFTPVL